MNIVKKIVLGAGALVVSAGSMLAQAVADPTVTAVEANIDKVGTLGGKAYLIAAGLALAGVAIAFIKKAKR